ncbi:hypothetical protein BD779DRAFT_1493869 [Infundibulicybe gibba]|nr:hypothetical protein BD779DRAFT_1584485 [Infundibulicybe gibba]KAF8875444.1 hypothetical protein BD779DRAFT_1563569 [Infundibulicybe gibba]KAF8876074.1 hypothetical protein BD779DRAFT_1561485 [Infundibulicybe gibba]KAF8896075.1 hypothetical protein BD779DRAFT_1493869 [Infundibulicybe gibba]
MLLTHDRRALLPPVPGRCVNTTRAGPGAEVHSESRTGKRGAASSSNFLGLDAAAHDLECAHDELRRGYILSIAPSRIRVGANKELGVSGRERGRCSSEDEG